MAGDAGNTAERTPARIMAKKTRSFGVHVRHEIPGGEEDGDVAAHVHDVVRLAFGEAAAPEQWQYLSAGLVDVFRGLRRLHPPTSIRSAAGPIRGVSVSLHRATPSRTRPWFFWRANPSSRMHRRDSRKWKSGERYQVFPRARS